MHPTRFRNIAWLLLVLIALPDVVFPLWKCFGPIGALGLVLLVLPLVIAWGVLFVFAAFIIRRSSLGKFSFPGIGGILLIVIAAFAWYTFLDNYDPHREMVIYFYPFFVTTLLLFSLPFAARKILREKNGL